MFREESPLRGRNCTNKGRAGSRGRLGSTPSIEHQDSDGDAINVTGLVNSPVLGRMVADLVS